MAHGEVMSLRILGLVAVAVLLMAVGVSAEPVPRDVHEKTESASKHRHSEQASRPGSRILVIPGVYPSHIRFFGLVGQALMEDGHQVDIIAPQRQKHLIEGMGPTVVPYKLVRPDCLSDDEPYNELMSALWETRGDDTLLMPATLPYFINSTLDVLESKEMWQHLDARDYDLVVIDGDEACHAQYVIPYRLGVPHITMAAWSNPWMYRVPALPSVQPHTISGILSNNDFTTRLLNLFAHIMHYRDVVNGEAGSVELVKTFAPNRPPVTLQEIYTQSEMWLIVQDTLLLDHPRVEAPHYRHIGGLTGAPAKTLTGQFAEFVAGAGEHGFIILSFGTIIRTIPPSKIAMILEAFSQIKQRVIMRNDDEYTGPVPENVLISRWIPQNDLLGHPQVRLFISHGGNNGQNEALYHGVPMLTLAFCIDHHQNGQRISRRGYGRYAVVYDVTTESLVKEINEVINNPSYKDTVKKASRMRHSLPDSRLVLRFWVNHILEYGGSHLRPPFMDMPLWQFFMLDIMATVLVAMFLLLFLIYKILKCLLRFCCKKSEAHLKQE